MRLFTFLYLVFGAACMPSAVSAEEALPSSQVPAAMLNPAAFSFDQLAATRDRPLFTPTRKPPEVAPPPVVAIEAPVAEPSPPSPPQVYLAGVIVDENGPRAMLRTDATKVTPVRIGDEVSGWMVTMIGRQQLTLSLDDHSLIVSLFQSKDQTAILHRHASHTAQDDRVFEVNGAGVLRSHRIKHPH